MNSAGASLNRDRIATALWCVFWGVVVIIFDLTLGLNEVRLDIVNDLIGAALVIGGLAAIRGELLGLTLGPWLAIAIAGGVASFARAACELSPTFDEDFSVVSGILGLAEIVGEVAFCIAMSGVVAVLGWADLARHWRICAWTIGLVHGFAVLGLLLVKASGSEEGAVGLIILVGVSAVGALVFFLSCIWRTAYRCRRSGPVVSDQA